jgi:hypothetical protein
MKKKKLLKKLQDYFDMDERRKIAHQGDLVEILKKLKEKERKIFLQFEKENDPVRKKSLKKELDIIYAQRKKGIKLLKESGAE